MLWQKMPSLCSMLEDATPCGSWEDALLRKGRALYLSFHAPEDAGALIWHPEVLLPMRTLKPHGSTAGHYYTADLHTDVAL